MPFQLPALPYANNALEPHFDAQTMEIHHDKHLGRSICTLLASEVFYKPLPSATSGSKDQSWC